MKHTKRALALLLAAVLLVGSLIPTAGAVTITCPEKAQVLFELGLFKGYDTTGNNFGLTDRATREQALVILLRMLGKDAEAQAWKGGSPFTDVPSDHWARAYIGYAKEKGLTVGIGNNKFGLGRYANMQEMTMFALRGLGYSDAANVKDFTWNSCLDLAVEKGILASNQAVSPFTRGTAVDIIYGSLFVTMKNQNYTLLQKLVNDGVVTQQQMEHATEFIPDLFDLAASGTQAASKTLTDRFNAAHTRYRDLLADLNRLDEDKRDELKRNEMFAEGLFVVTYEFDQMGKVIGEGIGIYAVDQIQEYNRMLDRLDQTMSELEGQIVSAFMPVTLVTVPIILVNQTGADLSAVYITAQRMNVWGNSHGTIANGASAPYTISFSAVTLKWSIKVEDGTGSTEFRGIDFTNCPTNGGTITLTIQNGQGVAQCSWY